MENEVKKQTSKQIVPEVSAKVPAQAALFKAYQDAATTPARKKALNTIIGFVVADPECRAAVVLKRIAGKGDKHCAAAIDPLLEVFWDGDYEWQEAVVDLLAVLAPLAPPAVRVKVGRFLGHVAVSSEFVGGSCVDTAAIKALAQIGQKGAEASVAAFMKRGWVNMIGEKRDRFEAEAN